MLKKQQHPDNKSSLSNTTIRSGFHPKLEAVQDKFYSSALWVK